MYNLTGVQKKRRWVYNALCPSSDSDDSIVIAKKAVQKKVRNACKKRRLGSLAETYASRVANDDHSNSGEDGSGDTTEESENEREKHVGVQKANQAKVNDGNYELGRATTRVHTSADSGFDLTKVKVEIVPKQEENSELDDVKGASSLKLESTGLDASTKKSVSHTIKTEVDQSKKEREIKDETDSEENEGLNLPFPVDRRLDSDSDATEESDDDDSNECDESESEDVDNDHVADSTEGHTNIALSVKQNNQNRINAMIREHLLRKMHVQNYHQQQMVSKIITSVNL